MMQPTSHKRLRSPGWLLGVGLSLLLLVGCATEQISWTRTGDALTDGQTAITKAPAKDRVLWEYRTAAVALRRGRYDLARRWLDDALLTSGGVISQDRGAKLARSYFHPESRKTFIGEPYERVMAYYYRAILYWMQGQPDNARACYRSAELQDTDVENHQYTSDYVLLPYLAGLATASLGGDGSDAYRQAVRAAAKTRLASPPPYPPHPNVLFFVEMGHGPTKYATGEYREELRFHVGYSEARSASIEIAGQTVVAPAYDDLGYQATTRGGRVMDHILANKAVFKSATDTAGNVGLIGGLVLAQNRETRDVGLGLAAAGLVSKIVAAATTPRADTRSWDNLPQLLGFAAFHLPPGSYPATIQFFASSGAPIPRLTQKRTVQVGQDQHPAIVFVSTLSGTSL